MSNDVEKIFSEYKEIIKGFIGNRFKACWNDDGKCRVRNLYLIKTTFFWIKNFWIMDIKRD